MRQSILLYLTILFLSSLISATSYLPKTKIPEQIHIAIGGPYEMTISWFTYLPTLTSTVKYGLTSFNLSQSETGNSQEYLKGFGFHHSVTLQNLKPSTRYFYSVGDGQETFSNVFDFYSPSDSNTQSFSFACFGDMGYLDDIQRPKIFYTMGLLRNWTAVPSRRLLESLKDKKIIDFIWHIGDIGYIDDVFAEYSLEFGYEKTYNNYMNWIQNLTTTIPYMVLPGNHESECHNTECFLNKEYRDSLRNFTAYNTRWKMPSKSSDGVLSMWYSFDYGPAHFIAMNTETDFPGAKEEKRGSTQILPVGRFAPNGTYLRWLENDLKKASAARASKSEGYRNWIIAGGHRPYWEIKDNGVEELFKKYGVDIYFSGHVHSYIRSAPVYKGKIDTKSIISENHYHDAEAPVYVTVGGAGCDEMSDVVDPFSLLYSDFLNKTESFATGLEKNVTSNLLSIGVLDVLNQTSLHWTLYDSVNGSKIDELWLSKSA
eukprot:c15773_g1_i1.p1 GENE.c15773_g1_i1~~c15773_g1_i1.p1  ORF type:complete len:486 (+),score=157.39 c15773_g1_i1:71-1528(+)